MYGNLQYPELSPLCVVAAQLEACSQVQSSANTSSEDTRILQTLALVAIQLSFLTTIILSGSGSGGGMLMSCSIISWIIPSPREAGSVQSSTAIVSVSTSQ